MDKNSVIKYLKEEMLNKNRYLKYAIEENFSGMVGEILCTGENLKI